MQKRLKILHWPTGYPDPEYGKPNSHIFVAEHVKAAAIYNDNVVLFISPEPPNNDSLIHISRNQELGILVIRIHTRHLRSHALNRSLVYLCLLFEFTKLLVNGYRPDIIHAHIFANAHLPITIARIFNIPFVVTEHWTALCREGVLSPKRQDFARYVYETAQMVFPVCNYLQKCIERNLGAKFNYQIILNAVDTAIFKFTSTTKAQKFPRIISVAALADHKGISTLLQAIAIIHKSGIKVYLDLIGEGPNREEYEELADKLCLSDYVTFYGYRPKPEIASLLQRSHIFALASEYENSPCVIGEAQCCGLPIVATSVGGVPELVPNSAGTLVLPKNPSALAKAAIDILTHPDNYNRAQIARSSRVRFSYQAIGRQLNEAYNLVITQ